MRFDVSAIFRESDFAYVEEAYTARAAYETTHKANEPFERFIDALSCRTSSSRGLHSWWSESITTPKLQ